MKTALRKTTSDHEQIRRWAEARGGHPATVEGTAKGGAVGLLRIDFPGYSGARSLREISWDEFFKKFDEAHLAMIYQEKTAAGKPSNFNKLVSAQPSPRRAAQPRATTARGLSRSVKPRAGSAKPRARSAGRRR